MGKRADISIEKRSAIITLMNENYSHHEIARKLNIPRTTVSHIIKHFLETGSLKPRKRTGRNKCTTDKEDRYIAYVSCKNRRLTAPEITAQFNESRDKGVSVSTVTRRLNQFGLHGRVAVKKPLLRPANKQKRLQWAKQHQTWSIRQWQKVLWSDESKFEIFGSHRRVYVRRRVGERMRDDCVVPTVKHGGGSLMIWGCFGNSKVGDLVEITGKLDKEGYLAILRDHALPNGLSLIGRGFVFQQDNDPKHSSKLCKGYLEEQHRRRKVNVMEWPPQSPDLNPIELLWEHLDRELRKTCPTSKSDMLDKINITWNAIQADVLDKLVERMPRLCKAVIAAKGGYFDESKI